MVNTERFTDVSSFKPVESKETLAEQIKALEAKNKAIKGESRNEAQKVR